MTHKKLWVLCSFYWFQICCDFDPIFTKMKSAQAVSGLNCHTKFVTGKASFCSGNLYFFWSLTKAEDRGFEDTSQVGPVSVQTLLVLSEYSKYSGVLLSLAATGSSPSVINTRKWMSDDGGNCQIWSVMTTSVNSWSHSNDSTLTKC